MNILLTMILLIIILDVAWVFGSGIYNNYVVGSMDPLTLAFLWAIVVMAQSVLLYTLTKHENIWSNRALLGALQGFTVYAVFNITAKVVFPSSMWPTSIALIDTLWGTILFATVAALTTPTLPTFDSAFLHPASIVQQ